MKLPRLSEETTIFLKKLPVYYALAGLIMAILAMVYSMPVPDAVFRIINVILIAYLAVGLLGVAGYVLMNTWIAWILDSDTDLAYRIVMAAAMVAIVWYGIAGNYLVAIPLVVAHSLLGWLINLASKNAKAASDQDGDWEKAEEEFWRNYDGSSGGDSNQGQESASSQAALPDPLVVLGLDAGASRAEIRSAYRSICMACHPDTNGGRGDPARFRRATEAYHALSS
jgi:hypothetical protein